MKKFLVLTILGIFLIPLSAAIPLRGQPIWYVQYLGLSFFLFLGVSVVLWKFNRWLSLLTLLCLLSAFFVTRRSPRAIMLLFHFDLACLASYGVSRIGYRKAITYAILALVVFQFSWMAVQAHNKDPFFDSKINNRVGKGLDEMVGFSGSMNQIGAFFAITLPIALHIFPPLALLSLTAIAISKSSFAFVAGIGGGLIYLFFTKRKVFLMSLALCLILGGIFFTKCERLQRGDFLTRPSVWKYAVARTIKGNITIEQFGKKLQIECNPILGYGFGNFWRIFPFVPYEATKNFNYPNEKFTHAHNDFVELFFEFGYLGLVCMLGLVINFLNKFRKMTYDKDAVLYFSCISAYLLNSLGNFPSHLAMTGMLLILLYGMFKGVWRENYE